MRGSGEPRRGGSAPRSAGRPRSRREPVRSRGAARLPARPRDDTSPRGEPLGNLLLLAGWSDLGAEALVDLREVRGSRGLEEAPAGGLGDRGEGLGVGRDLERWAWRPRRHRARPVLGAERDVYTGTPAAAWAASSGSVARSSWRLGQQHRTRRAAPAGRGAGSGAAGPSATGRSRRSLDRRRPGVVRRLEREDDRVADARCPPRAQAVDGAMGGAPGRSSARATSRASLENATTPILNPAGSWSTNAFADAFARLSRSGLTSWRAWSARCPSRA